jgi:two-component system heavy metal sensor histidine kinase CusS
VRLVAAMAALTLLTLGLSFWAVAFSFNRAQERQLDEALLVEAASVAQTVVTPDGDFTIRDGLGPAVNDAGSMPLYGVVYDEEGRARAATSTFGADRPEIRALVDVQASAGASPPTPRAPYARREPFDLAKGSLRLRGVVVPVPRRPGADLLLAMPRADLDGDAAFLGHAMLSVFAVASVWSILVPIWLIRRLTRDHQAIADTVLRVASGDFQARARISSGDPEIARLGDAVDTMIERLGLLLASQERFVARAAHELRSPLTLVQGQLALALRRPRSVDEYREAVAEALASASDLRSLTDELLDLARAGTAGAGPFEPTSLTRAARAALRQVRAEADGAGVILDLRGDEAVVAGRPGDLERLLRNLVENAVRHSPRGGRVLVDLVAGQRGGRAVEIAVADEGEGVPEGERDRLFEPFFRGAGAQGTSGAGLGLAIAREIARAHGGDVHLDPTPSRGARFVVRLPLPAVAAVERAGHRGNAALVERALP